MVYMEADTVQEYVYIYCTSRKCYVLIIIFCDTCVQIE